MRTSKRVFPYPELLLLITAIVFSSRPACAQSTFRSAPVSFGTQAAALGNAYVAHVQDITGMYWNPASISFLETYAVVASAITDSQTDLFHHMVASPVWRSERHFLGAAIVGSHFGERWYQPHFSNYGLDIGYSTKLSPFLSVGTLVNLRYGRTFKSSLWAVSGNVGLIYYPSRGITYGIQFEGMGPGMVYHGETPDQALSLDWTRPKRITLGSTFRFPTTTSYPTMTFSIDSGLDPRSREVTSGIGVELIPWKPLMLRVGLARDSVTTFRCGVGIQVGYLEFGYAFVPLSNGNRFHHASLSYSLRIGNGHAISTAH